MATLLNPHCHSCSCVPTVPTFVGGEFTAIDGTSRLGLARLNGDGTVDAVWSADISNAAGNEPGTQQGSQWSPAFFLGDRERGLFGGASFFFDFQNRPGRGSSSLVSSVVTLGYTWDCCAVTAQNFTFNTGLRAENRVVFSFRLNGIGTFGTEQIGQHFR